MRLLNLFFLVLFFSFNVNAELKRSHLVLSPGQNVYYEMQVNEPTMPTLVMLPGVYRGLTNSDSLIYKLFQNNVNFVALHFSTQPKSIATYSADEKTHFDGGDHVTSELLATEIENAIERLNIEKPILVTLSYSATLSEHFDRKKFPVIVDTAPLARFDDAEFGLKEILESWEAWLSFFPGATEMYKTLVKDQMYRQHWSKVAKDYSKGNEKLQSEKNQTRLTDGYMAQAKAVEKYDIRAQEFAYSPKRIFILAEKEEPRRLKLQLAAIENYKMMTGDHEAQPIIISGAGHTVPTDQPQKYFEVLTQIMTQVYK